MTIRVLFSLDWSKFPFSAIDERKIPCTPEMELWKVVLLYHSTSDYWLLQSTVPLLLHLVYLHISTSVLPSRSLDRTENPIVVQRETRWHHSSKWARKYSPKKDLGTCVRGLHFYIPFPRQFISSRKISATWSTRHWDMECQPRWWCSSVWCGGYCCLEQAREFYICQLLFALHGISGQDDL
jgi:hypothetical protein